MSDRLAALRLAWERLSPRERMISSACAAVLGTALVWTGVVTPVLGYLEALQTQIDTRQIKLAKYDQWMRASSSQTITADLLAVQTTGAVNEDMSKFLKEIEQMAQGSGARIVDLKPLAAEKKGVQERLGVDLQLETGLAALTRYLYKIQTSPHLLEVNRFQVSTGDGPGLRASLLITQTLFLAEPVRPRERRTAGRDSR